MDKLEPPAKPLPEVPTRKLTAAFSVRNLRENRHMFLERPHSTRAEPVTYSLALNDKEIKALKRFSSGGSMKMKDQSNFIDNFMRRATQSSGHGSSGRNEISGDFAKDAKMLSEQWCRASIRKKWKTATTEGIVDLACLRHGFNVEFPENSSEMSGLYDLEENEKETPYYNDVLSQLEHDNFLGTDPSLGPIILTIEGRAGNYQRILRCIVRTKKGDQRVAIIGNPEKMFPETADGRLRLFKEISPEFAEVKFSHIRDKLDFPNSLRNFEKNQLTPNYKFGILYVKEGQSDENSFFSNVETSSSFEKFLECIGDKVKMKGFDKFCGGLDSKSDTTGTHSIYAFHKGYQIMFHVSTMLPYTDRDPQQVRNFIEISLKFP
eukprot:TRINITY_DN2516_c0_g2_i1.p1 TRINITY_DN2516_c0_g2~~TRINITY_DN2516_c0_g2_i1.p1  ORF type:complete len:378 (+),score=82.78 TRINITY_DN2516_c0_g2_i1:185-1318(+)